MLKANGGFPPIRYCETNNDEIKLAKRERSFAPKMDNVNIRQILKKNNNPIIQVNVKKETKIDIVEDF